MAGIDAGLGQALLLHPAGGGMIHLEYLYSLQPFHSVSTGIVASSQYDQLAKSICQTDRHKIIKEPDSGND